MGLGTVGDRLDSRWAGVWTGVSEACICICKTRTYWTWCRRGVTRNVPCNAHGRRAISSPDDACNASGPDSETLTRTLPIRVAHRGGIGYNVHLRTECQQMNLKAFSALCGVMCPPGRGLHCSRRFPA